MALIFSPSITQLMATTAVLENLYPSLGDGNTNGTATSVTVYSGTQPTAATILANWGNYNSSNSNLLAHFEPIVWIIAPGNANAVQIQGTPTATPISSGTATWAILWTGLQANISSSTIPTTSFFVAPVTDISGTGIIRFTSAVLTSGTPVNIADGGILTNFI